VKTRPAAAVLFALALALSRIPSPAADAADGDAGGSPVAVAPREVDPRDRRVGELVADVEVSLLDGTKRRLSRLAGPKGLVIVARSEGCPVGRKYAPVLATMERAAVADGFGWLYVNVAAADGAEAAAKAVQDYGFTAPYALDGGADGGRRLARELALTSTTECFVLDPARTLRFRGAVDDRIGLGYQVAAPRHEYLRAALDAVAKGRVPLVEATTAPGCVVETGPAPPTSQAPDVTWHNRVSRIVDRNCVECHRDGEAGPFPLVTRDDVLAQREMVEFVVGNRTMPPWFASRGHADFATDRSLSDRDRADLLAWIRGGAPLGDARDAAKPIERVKGWHLGTPDLVLQGREFDVPASGVVEYQYQWIEASADQDRWVRAVEVRPSAPEVVHHVLVFARFRKDDPRSKTQGPFDGGVTGYFAAAVPGQGWFEYPEGMAKRWPAGTDLLVQVHYTPNGKPAKDRPTVGIVFAKEPPKREVRTRGVFDLSFRIPPGAERHEVRASWTFPKDGTLLEFMPHMHVRGAAFRYEVETPEGERRTILDIPRYDFNWQLVYRLREPVAVTRGTRIHATGWFDNSARNPANPDPARTVTFGEQTADEMMIGYLDWVTDL
jgi:mono/diheme cytochrome c family protein